MQKYQAPVQRLIRSWSPLISKDLDLREFKAVHTCTRNEKTSKKISCCIKWLSTHIGVDIAGKKAFVGFLNNA